MSPGRRALALGALVACAAPPAKAPPSNVPARDATIVLTWEVHAHVPDPKDADGMLLAPLVLVAGSERIELKLQLGSLKPYYQSACPAEVRGYGLEGQEVAKITFTEGGAGGYVVTRTPRGLALIEWNQGHDTCTDPKTGEMTACPRSEIEVRVLPVPASTQVVQKIVNVDAAGKQTPFSCSLD